MLFIIFVTAGVLPGLVAAEPAAALKLARSGAFDAGFETRCAQDIKQPMRACPAAVARSDTAEAMVVTFPSGFARTLTFANDDFLRGNPTMSGVGRDIDWRLTDGTYFIRVDDQRFELSARQVFDE